MLILWAAPAPHSFPRRRCASLHRPTWPQDGGYAEYPLRIEDQPKTFLDINKKEKVLGITGQIMNETGKPIEIPLLKAILLGSKGENVKSWTFEAKQRRIDPGEKIKYETSLANPPSGATGLQITFTRAEEEMMDDKMKALDAK